ncbi:LysR family transcriptional regulator [Bordetella genomosp. 8]|uniref:LysR family transcriptional regulator n=2 Tax=Bordetella genomosp. 8 TaxID=1416806 RepID=A0A1W6YMG6_9BORD|nr:LysR family transcriptional regulator [Bordetella genomosp. 8]
MTKRLQTMELFVEVARAKSFSRAALVLGIPKSTLSRQVAELERSLGVQLLSRTTRKVELTDAGSRYFERCQHIVAEAQIADQEIQGLASTPAGPLRVNMPVDFGTDFLAESLMAFSRRYPDVTFHLDMAAPEHAGKVFLSCDVAIEIGERQSATHIARLLGSISVYLYASPEYLASRGVPRQPDDLTIHECMEFRATLGARVTPWPLHRNGERIEFHPGKRFSLNSASMLRRLATLGAGIAVLSDVSASQEVAAGRLQRVLPDWEVGPFPVYAVTETRLLPVKTRIFVEFLTERLQHEWSRQGKGSAAPLPAIGAETD